MTNSVPTVFETRILKTFALKTESRSAGESKISGYAALFDVMSENLGGFQEKIEPGAFQNNLKGADVRALINHDANFVLGRTTSGTLDLHEDGKGLAFTIIPPDTQSARDLLTSLQRGDVDQMSFAFKTIRDDWDTSGLVPIRTLLEVKLFDISVVTFPAYPQTSAQVRCLSGSFGSIHTTVDNKTRRRLLDILERGW